MTFGLPIVDSSQRVTDNFIRQARNGLNANPAAWGRYFATGGSVEYRHRQENAPLARFGVRVLPIARRTRNVEGPERLGALDGRAVAEDLLSSFDADYLAAHGGRFLVFLDVESELPLSEEYYRGWSNTLATAGIQRSAGRVTFLPSVYASVGDSTTWSAVAAAAESDTPCHGAWVARWVEGGCSRRPEWDADFVQPAVQLPCDILLWQFAANCVEGAIDVNQTNPSSELSSMLLAGLIPPPVERLPR